MSSLQMQAIGQPQQKSALDEILDRLRVELQTLMQIRERLCCKLRDYCSEPSQTKECTTGSMVAEVQHSPKLTEIMQLETQLHNEIAKLCLLCDTLEI